MPRYKDRQLDRPLKVMLDSAMYDKIGTEASARGISMAEVLRLAYAEHEANAHGICERCVHYVPCNCGGNIVYCCELEACEWSWEDENG